MSKSTTSGVLWGQTRLSPLLMFVCASLPAYSQSPEDIQGCLHDYSQQFGFKDEIFEAVTESITDPKVFQVLNRPSEIQLATIPRLGGPLEQASGSVEVGPDGQRSVTISTGDMGRVDTRWTQDPMILAANFQAFCGQIKFIGYASVDDGGLDVECAARQVGLLNTHLDVWRQNESITDPLSDLAINSPGSYAEAALSLAARKNIKISDVQESEITYGNTQFIEGIPELSRLQGLSGRQSMASLLYRGADGDYYLTISVSGELKTYRAPLVGYRTVQTIFGPIQIPIRLNPMAYVDVSGNPERFNRRFKLDTKYASDI